MLKTKFLFLILSLFLTGINPERILFHETVIVDSLSLTENELIDIIIKKHQIKTDYKTITIESDYFNNPKFNQLYSVTLETNYDDQIIIYNLKLKVVNENEPTVNDKPIILIISMLSIILLIVYLSIKK